MVFETVEISNHQVLAYYAICWRSLAPMYMSCKNTLRLQRYEKNLDYTNFFCHFEQIYDICIDFPSVWKIFGKKLEKVCIGLNLLQNKLFLKKNVEKLVYMKKKAVPLQRISKVLESSQSRVKIGSRFFRLNKQKVLITV